MQDLDTLIFERSDRSAARPEQHDREHLFQLAVYVFNDENKAQRFFDRPIKDVPAFAARITGKADKDHVNPSKLVESWEGFDAIEDYFLERLGEIEKPHPKMI